jgi:hypothetical protein
MGPRYSNDAVSLGRSGVVVDDGASVANTARFTQASGTSGRSGSARAAVLRLASAEAGDAPDPVLRSTQV